MEKRRRMAQPGWKATREAQDLALIQQQERVRQALSNASTPPTAPGMHTLTSIPELQSPAEQVTEQPVQQAMPTSSTYETEWDEWCHFQESASMTRLHCTAAPAQAPRKGASALHCWSIRDESLDAFQPCSLVRGLAIAFLWERLLVCYGKTILAHF